MRLSLKTKISLGYTWLLMIVLASTLFIAFKIVGFQLKNEITRDLQFKRRLILRTMGEADHLGEHADEAYFHSKSESREFKHGEEHQREEEILDRIGEGNLIVIYKNNKLSYLNPQYRSLANYVQPFPLQNGEIKDFSLGDRKFSMAVVDQQASLIYIGTELSTLVKLQNKLLRVFLILFPIGVMLSFFVSIFVTQRSMNILKRINDTARSITSDNLSRRIEVPEGNDEITHLITTLNQMIDRLEKSFEQVKQFSQDAAHEIRTPLTIIRAEVEEFIGQNKPNKKTVEKMQNVLQEIQYLSSISERLLLIHTLDTNKVRYHFENISLSALMSEIVQDAKIIATERGIEVTSTIEPTIEMKCNRELITRLLWNLIDNAIKYNQAQGQVNLHLYTNDIAILLQVKDTGIGIATDEIPKIFDRFYRVDKSRSRKLSGSGLGLAICKWIIDLHGGEISLESQEDQGTTFKVSLPK